MKDYLKDDYRKFIHLSRYSRWQEKNQRREHWPETVDRYMTNVVGPKMDKDISDMATYEEVREAILQNEICPSMRAMMTAGPG